MQLLGIWGVQRWGYPAFAASAVAGSLALAFLSWHLVEKRALNLKKFDPKVILAARTKRLSAAQVEGSEADAW
jgi:peptidoglycan/LPS O-acetylase OafA/YrhL